MESKDALPLGRDVCFFSSKWDDTAPARQTGMLTRKIIRQLKWVRIRPPKKRPTV